MVLLGLAIGVAGGLASGRFLETLLFEVKMTDAADRVIIAKEYNNLTSFPGYMNFTYTGLARGQMFRAQANVDGIDGNRTDVVSASSVVKLA